MSSTPQRRVEVFTWEQLTQLYEPMPCGVLISDRSGTILLANPAALELFRARKEDLIDFPMESLLADACRGLHPGLRGAVPEGPLVLGWGAGLRGVTKEGTEFAVKVTIAPIHTQDGVAIVNIVEPHQIHDEAAQERSFLAAIVESSEDSIVGTDLDGVIMSWNQAAEKLFGYPATEVLGTPIEILFPEGYGGDPRMVSARIRAKESIERLETRRLTKDGRLVNVSTTLAPIRDARGTLQGISAIYRDITKAKLAQAELIQAKKAAEAASRAKSEFVANMSHEIRTPMNVLLGMSNLLLDTTLTPEQADYSRSIRRGAESLLVIINDILDFSKVEAGKLEINPVDFVLEELLADVADMMSELISRKPLAFHVSVDPELPPVVHADAARLRQVLVNLIGNAIKFTERGEVNVAVKRRGRSEPPVLLFEVRDTGIGVPAEVQEYIFEAFAQADGSTTRKYGGTGLGLAISRRLVTLMGGEMTLESEEGVGATFRFTVPLVAGTAEVSLPARNLSALAGLRVLIVDDNETNRRIVREQLRPLGIACEEAADAMQGIIRLREACTRFTPFDLAIVDFEMPGMNGIDLARVIRADRRLAQLQLVLMTSYSERECRDTAQEAGINAVLNKPIRTSEFRQCLLQATERIGRRANQEPHEAATKGKLLLVEDNPDNRTLALKILEKAGYVCDVAVNGREAIEAVARERYRLVLMDCQMPEVDGLRATSEIRKAEQGTRRTPIVAMTAHAMQGDRERCLAVGMDDYITKPIAREALLALVEARAVKSTDDAPNSAMEKRVAEPIPVTVARDLSELIPGYLSNRRSDLELIARALAVGDFEKVRVIGHGMNGSGGGYGLPRISEIGRDMERAARAEDRRQIETLARTLDDFVSRVQLTYR